MNEHNFYLTTPIYYVNDRPHIGHAYTTILADVLARYHRSLGEETFFLTGTDEHGQKVERAAMVRGEEPIRHCDETVKRFQELWARLGITNDRFIRTTQEFHKTVVRKVLQDLYDRGEIYRDEYIGWYCVGDERFFTEKDLVDGKCPECGREVTEIKEFNYFFRMSKYREWLIDYIQTHPDFIQPAFRANETLGFLKKGLSDLCITRPKSRLAWGIEMPFDPDYVCYVWFDALLNYVSGVGYLQDDATFSKWWPASYHLIGKDILTTHSVYWPTMLHAMGLPLPKTIFAHGWLLTNNTKMSKSLGNTINPMDMIDKAGVDAFRYFLLAEMAPGSDANFTEAGFLARFNSDLANDLGNLLSRVVKLTQRSANGVIPKPGKTSEDEAALEKAVADAVTTMESTLREMKLDQGIAAVMNAVRVCNRYFDQRAPWTLAKNGDTDALNTVLFHTAEVLRKVAVLLAPVMPEKMAELRAALGYDRDKMPRISEIGDPADTAAGRAVRELPPLFMRILSEEEKAAVIDKAKKKAERRAARAEGRTIEEDVKMPNTDAKANGGEKKEKPAAQTAPELPGVITIEDFAKLRLRTATILAAERIEGADKLLKLQIDVGGEKRQLVAGIAKHYTPEELVGKTIVVIANLKPAKLRGVESQGMLLAAFSGDELKLLTTDGELPSGSAIR